MPDILFVFSSCTWYTYLQVHSTVQHNVKYIVVHMLLHRHSQSFACNSFMMTVLAPSTDLSKLVDCLGFLDLLDVEVLL